MKKLLLLGLAVLLAGIFGGCGGGGSGSPPAQLNANVVGQLSMPEAHDLPKFEVYLDDNLNPLDGFVKKVSDRCQCQLLIDYLFVDAPAGTYYVYGIVRLKSAEGTAPVAGDLVGYYTGTNNPADPPVQVVVTASGKVDALINMQTVP